jgi:hypothetical protein
MVNLNFKVRIGIMENLVNVPNDFFGRFDWRNHVKSIFDVELWQLASISHPTANKKVLDKVVRQLEIEK